MSPQVFDVIEFMVCIRCGVKRRAPFVMGYAFGGLANETRQDRKGCV